MKILICTNSLGAKGGLEKITIVKANALADIDGNEVAICFTDKGTYPEYTIHVVSPKLRIYDLGVSFWDLYPLSVKNLLVTAPKKFMALRKSLRRVIADFSPDVIVTTGSYEKFGLASLNPAKITGHQTVKIREFHFSSNYRRYSDNVKFPHVAEFFDLKVLPHFFDKYFLLTKEDYNTNFIGNPKYDYVNNPSTLKKEEDLSPIQTRRRKVITVARLEYQKNIESMLRVWAKVAAHCPGWSLDIVGEGSMRKTLENLASELDISDSVSFLGFRKDVDELLVNSRIFLLTSRYEGFPLVIPEAMAAGTVPVSFRLPYGPADIIVDGVSGILVKYNDEQKMADRLIALMEDEDMQARMSCAARKRVDDFSLDTIISQWIDKYKALLSSRCK